MTNGDKLRQMTDEELADRIPVGDCYCCLAEELPYPEYDYDYISCHDCALMWLKKEADT